MLRAPEPGPCSTTRQRSPLVSGACLARRPQCAPGATAAPFGRWDSAQNSYEPRPGSRISTFARSPHESAELLRVLLHKGPRVVVDRDHHRRTDEVDRRRRVLGPHGEVVTDGEQRDVHLVLEELHVEGERGVSCVIDAFARAQVEEQTRGICGKPLGPFAVDHPAVRRDRHLDATEGEAPRAADVHGVSVFDSLTLHIGDELEAPHHRGSGRPGDGDRVREVVLVAVRAEDEVGFDVRGLDLRPGIVVEERIDDDAGAVIRRERERRVTVKLESRHRRILCCRCESLKVVSLEGPALAPSR